VSSAKLQVIPIECFHFIVLTYQHKGSLEDPAKSRVISGKIGGFVIKFYK